jgi:hypothetical protein
MKTLFLLMSFSFFMISFSLRATVASDSVSREEARGKSAEEAPYHKNVIKINPTPMLIWGQITNITLSYERLITRNQSLSLQAGYLLFPKLIQDSVINLIVLKDRSKNGINLSLDWRYYPLPRNKRPAPDGLYVGAYISYYGFTFRNAFDVLNTDVDQNGAIKGSLNIGNLGLMLGYQFIFWKRVSVDLLLFGPSISYYSAKLKIEGSLDKDQIHNIDQEFVDRLIRRFPLLASLFTQESLTFTGARTSLSLGFRYSIQLGFHF